MPSGASYWPGVLHVPGQREDAVALRLLGAEVGEPVRAVGDDRRHARDRLDVVDDGRARVQALDGGERRPVPRQAAVALERGQQRRLLAADVRARARVHDQLEVEAAAEDVLAEVARLVGLGHRELQPPDRVQHLAAHVDERVAGPDRVAGDDGALDEHVRVGHHQRDVLARARLGLVGVDREVVRLAVVLGDEGPLHAGREARAAAAAQRPRLDRRDHVVRRHRQRLRQRLVPAGALVPVQRERVGLVPVRGQNWGEGVCHEDSLPAVEGDSSEPFAAGAFHPRSLASLSPTRLACPADGPSAAWPSP